MFRVDAPLMDRCRDRRRRLVERCGGGIIVARGGAPGATSRNFAYLSGVPEPRAALVLAPDGVRIGVGRANPGADYQRGKIVHSLLFLPPSDPLARKWGEDGVATLGAIGAEQAGFDQVLDVAAMSGVVEAELAASPTVHVVRGADPTFAGEPSHDERWVEQVRRRWFHADVRDATSLVHAMRRAKDGLEIDRIRRSVEVTRGALEAAWRVLAPGVVEREVEAEITRCYLAAGGGHAFDPIVGSGSNACLLHYTANARTIEAGELVLVDTGALVGGYAADVTRTVPSSGTFNDRQRELYELVLRAQEAAITACRPGALLGDVHAAAFAVLEEAGLGDAYPHGTSHHLGADVHDVGDRFAPLEPGCVVTVEPGVYLPDEGIGIRIEDDIRVTEDGHENLTAAIPRAAADVEAWLASCRAAGESA
jgi:Xaa-Pro aminopeptidase